MTFFLLFISAVLLLGVLFSKLSDRIGVPVLLGFLALGMVFGSDGIFRIPFENYDIVNHISTIALIFIIFYGGFGTNWKSARPVAVAALLSPFHAPAGQQGVVAWAGLRGGATSVVFAIMVVISGVKTEHDLFHIAFCVVLLSIGVQGTLLPWCAQKLDMIDPQGNVMRTFTDYSGDETLLPSGEVQLLPEDVVVLADLG